MNRSYFVIVNTVLLLYNYVIAIGLGLRLGNIIAMGCFYMIPYEETTVLYVNNNDCYY